MKNTLTEKDLQQYLARLQNDPKERAAMNKAWQREIKKEEKRNPKSAAIDFMKAIRF
jgi:hypothetical protein